MEIKCVKQTKKTKHLEEFDVVIVVKERNENDGEYSNVEYLINVEKFKDVFYDKYSSTSEGIFFNEYEVQIVKAIKDFIKTKQLSEDEWLKINNESLVSIWDRLKDDNTSLIMFSAFSDSDECDENINYKNNASINKGFFYHFRNNKMLCFYVHGYFQEDKGTLECHQKKEDILIAVSSKNQSQNLIKLAKDISNSEKKYNILVRDSRVIDRVYLLYSDGKKEVLDEPLTPSVLAKYYAKLRHKNENNTFVFESVEHQKGWISHWSESLKRKGQIKS